MSNTHYASLCPVVLPSSLPKHATINGRNVEPSYRSDSCNIFNKNRVNRLVLMEIPEYVLYPDSIGSQQYILGRKSLLDLSGSIQASNQCSSVQVLVLPWYNPHDMENNDAHSPGVNSWTPEINDLFIQCCSNMIYRSTRGQFGGRMMIWAKDIEYIRDLVSLSDLVSHGQDCKQLSLFIPGNPAQSNVEACQLFFHHSKQDNQIQLLAERSTTRLYYTCFLVQARQLKFIQGPVKTFVNITEAFVSKLKRRLDAASFRLFEPYYTR